MYRFIFLIFLSSSLHAQFLIEPSPTEGSNSPSASFFNAESHLSNHSDSTLTLVWKRITNEIPAGWESGICTNQGCLPPEVDEGSFDLESGFSVEFSCSFFPNDIPGSAKVVVNIWLENDTSQMIQQTYFGQTDPLTNIVHTNLASPLSIFPNPVSETFSLSQSNQIDKVEIFNALGQRLYQYPAQTSYDVQFLEPDLYFVKILTKQNETLAVLKLIKR